jgi:hypothetical protein
MTESRRRPGEDDFKSYFRAIEEEFTRLRGDPLVLSPEDWHRVAEWHERGIPLRVVLEALNAVFAQVRARSRRRPVLGLAYCRHAVEEAFLRHVENSVGGGSGAPEPAFDPSTILPMKMVRIRRSAESWPGASRGWAERACRLLSRTSRSLSSGELRPEEAEARLQRIERRVLDGLFQSLPESERAEILSTVEKRMAAHPARMSPEVTARTHRHVRDAEIRRRLELPRLSLLAD